MPRSAPLTALALLVAGAAACGPDQGALSTALVPTQAPDHYVKQGLKYFDTFDTSADRASIPDYSPLAARWEWPPWLLLTAYGRDMLLDVDPQALKATPSTIPKRECRAFAVQPFARCYVSFQYERGACPIYEEFTFNDAGQMTFIEAWSDLPNLRPTTEADRWGERPGVRRLSTRVPGLGNAAGLIDLEAPWMKDAAARDPEIADFVKRASDFWPSWLDAYAAAGPTLFARGCGW